MRHLVQAGVAIDSADNHSMSALHYASQASCLPSMQVLLANNASVNVVSSLKETPLSLAARASSSNKDAVEAISMLLTAGASLSCLHKMLPELSPAAQDLLQQHVRRASLATAGSPGHLSSTARDLGRSFKSPLQRYCPHDFGQVPGSRREVPAAPVEWSRGGVLHTGGLDGLVQLPSSSADRISPLPSGPEARLFCLAVPRTLLVWEKCCCVM